MKSNNNLHYYIIYFIGFFHWFFFFYFVDFYNYQNININDEIKVLHEKSSNIKFDISEGLTFKSPYSIKKLSDNYLKGDRDLIKKIINKPKISNFFKKKKFLTSDWSNEHNVLNVIQYALKNKTMPYHSEYGVGNGPKENRFLGNPMISISPQLLILNFFDTQTSFFINLIFMYSIGFIGCILFRKEFKLNNTAFVFLFCIFNFNGYFVQKITAYGPHLLGYYIIPFFLYFIFKTYKLKKNRTLFVKAGMLIGVTNSLILLQGSIHLYTCCVTFLCLWAIFNLRLYLVSFFAFTTNFALSSIKIFPAFFAYGNIENHRYWEAGGYSNLSTFFESLVATKNIFDHPVAGYHELSLYVSFFGLMLLIYFAFIYPLTNDQNNNYNFFKKFGLPILIMIFISFRHFKHLIIPQWIPLLNSESVTTRYMIIPLLVILFISVIYFQKFIKTSFKSLKIKVVVYFSMTLMIISLFNHSRLWRMHLIENKFLWYEKLISLNYNNLEKPLINNNYNDTFYIYSFWLGLFFSIITLFTVIFFFIIKRNKKGDL